MPNDDPATGGPLPAHDSSRETAVPRIDDRLVEHAPSEPWVWSCIALLVLVASALVVRHLFVTGVVFIDDLGYSQAAHDLLAGRFRLQPWPAGQARVGLYAPVALCYALLGASETTTLLFPLACSLASVAVVYAIGRLLAGERAGLIGAFLWAVCALDVQMAGALLPDGPVAMLGAAAVWLFLRADLRRPRRSRAGYAAAGLCLAFAVLVKPLALIVLPFAALYLLIDRGGRVRTAAFVPALLAAGAGFYAYYYSVGGAPTTTEGLQLPPLTARVAATATDWTRRLFTDPVFAAYTPLALAATVALLARPRRLGWVAVLWAGCSFLLFELGSVSIREYMPIPAAWRASQILPVLLPFAVVGGVYLARTTSTRATRWIVGGASVIVAVTAAAGSKTAPLLSWAVTGGSPDTLPLATVSGLSTAVAVFGAIASPLFVYRGRLLFRGLALGTVLTAIGIASLHAAQVAVLAQHEAWYLNLRSVAGFLETQGKPFVYVQNKVLAARLNVASRFTLGFDYFEPTAQAGRLHIAPLDPSGLTGPALVVIDDEMLEWSRPGGLGDPPAYLRTPPADWALVFSAGTVQGHRTRVYRFSPADAQREFAEARRAAAASPDASTLARLVGASAAAGDFCSAASSWLRLRESFPSAAEPFDPSGLLKGCLSQNPDAIGANLLRNGDFASGTDAWWSAPDVKADRSVEGDRPTGSPVMRIGFRGGNWVVMAQQVMLEPDTAYVYSMRVRTTGPVVALYWQADAGHPFEGNRVYREWTTLVSAFVTPHWNGRPMAASFSPVLMAAPGEAWLSDVRLARFTLDRESR
jgi:4-amino-4-deoxy-L-arabinose transferase-like glycosyltransferase